jgi:hypothetical protein
MPGDSDPPPFMTAPTACARAAVRLLHSQGDAAAAKLYLGQSKVGEWTNHTNASMASGARAVVDGFDWYVAQDAADGRSMETLDAKSLVVMPAGPVEARLDVVLEDGDELAGRVVLWDGPNFSVDMPPVMAYPFARALQNLYPGRTFTTVGIWQGRRQRLVEVPFPEAIARAAAANGILERM